MRRVRIGRKQAPSIGTILRVAAMALVAACKDQAPTAPAGEPAPMPLLSAAPTLFSLCHRTAGTNVYILIAVAGRAVQSHVAHGDGFVGDPVPNVPDMVFDANCAPVPARLAFSFADPVGDHLQLTPTRQLNPPAGVIDIVGLDFTFNKTTGDYEIILTASAANPFVGGFRITVPLFNPDVGTTAQDPAFFIDGPIDFFLTAPATSVTLTGSDPKLLAWKSGDRVAACQGTSFDEFGPCLGGLGLPDGITGFSTGVYTFATPPPFGLPKGSDVFFTAPAATIGN